MRRRKFVGKSGRLRGFIGALTVVAFAAVGIGSAQAGTIAFDQTIYSSTPHDFNLFGGAVALSEDGSLAVIGAPGDAAHTLYNEGTAKVLSKSGDTWTELQELRQSGAREGDDFGTSTAVSASGNTIVVGAQDGDVTPGQARGSISIFTRNGSQWAETTKIAPPTGSAVGFFGYEVDISAAGNVIVVGSVLDDHGSVENQGSAYVYRLVDGVWVEDVKLRQPGGGEGDRFGNDVAISGDGQTIMVGSNGYDHGVESNQGSVVIYHRVSGSWQYVSTMLHPGGDATDSFGTSVDLDYDGTTAVAGAPLDEIGTNRQGSVLILNRSGDAWSTGQIVTQSNAATNGKLGQAVSLSDDGNTLLVGAPEEIGNGISVNPRGEGIMFRNNGGSWVEGERLRHATTWTQGVFARKLDLAPDGRSVLIGSSTARVNLVATGLTEAYVLSNTLSVNKAGAGIGTITSEPSGISCSASSCSKLFRDGRVVTLTATAGQGSAFSGWSGACSGSGSTCQVTMDQARSVTGEFRISHYRLTADVTGAGEGTVNSSPAGIECDPTCSDWFEVGSTVTLTAEAASNSRFTGWSGDCQGDSPTCQVTISRDLSVGANFAKVFEVTVMKTGTGGGSVASAPSGIDCGPDCSATFDQGTTVELTADPDSNSIFSGWTGCESETGTECTVTASQARSVEASFTALHDLSVSTAGTGSGRVTDTGDDIDCGADCAAKYTHGSSVQLTAASSPGSTFDGWSGDCTGVTGACVVDMDQSRQVTATFTATEYELSVSKSGTGSGTVSSSPARIACGTTCSADFTKDSTVVLTATPSATSILGSWSGACTGTSTTCEVTMSEAKSVEAHFIATAYELSVETSGPGTVRSRTAGIDCGTDCHEVYPDGVTVVLDAHPAEGAEFLGWGGACAPGGTTCQVTMDQARRVTSQFRAVEPNPEPTPKVSITKKPKKKTKSRNASFVFKSSVPGSAFTCSIDRKPFRACAARVTFKRLKFGSHRLRVRAISGSKKSAVVTYSWKIARR